MSNGKLGFRIVPKMIGPSTCAFFIVYSNGEKVQIGLTLFPNDQQMNDNLITANEICDALRKRIKRSV